VGRLTVVGANATIVEHEISSPGQGRIHARLAVGRGLAFKRWRDHTPAVNTQFSRCIPTWEPLKHCSTGCANTFRMVGSPGIALKDFLNFGEEQNCYAQKEIKDKETNISCKLV
jgi:hypothetical protein